MHLSPRQISEIATALLGRPNEHQSSRDQLRFGSNGSLAVELIGERAGAWYDHEHGMGGGILDLIREKKGLVNGEAMEWLGGFGVEREDRRPMPEHPPAHSERPQSRIVATYDYHAADGSLLFQVVRKEPKTFLQRRPDPQAPGGWTWKVKGLRVEPYHLPDLLAAAGRRTILIAEGEKDVDALRHLGLSATCNPGGAGKWPTYFSDYFRGARVVILPDNDTAGRDHARMVAASLHPVAESVRVLELPGLPPKGDVSDWIAAGGTRDALAALAQETAPWQPPAPEAGPPPAETETPPPVSPINHEPPGPVDFSGSPVPAKQRKRDKALPPGIWERVAVLNDRHALVLIGDKAMILCEETGADGETEITFRPPTALAAWYANNKVETGDESISVFKLWMSWKDRRSYRGVSFDPSVNGPIQTQDGEVYNLWRGFAVTPKAGDWSLLRQHIMTNLCDDNERHFDWVLGWCAQMVQHPAVKAGKSLVLRGKQGTGKTIFGDCLGRLFGPHYIRIENPRYLTGNFNAHMISTLLIQADEGFWAGDKAAEAQLKGLVTSERTMIEKKGVDAFFVPNYSRLLITSNEDWVVPASMEQRRFAVFEVGDGKIQNGEFFGKLMHQMNNGGLEAMLHDLLAFDLETVDLGQIPATAALTAQKLASLSPEQEFWYERLRDSRLLPHHDGWHDTVPTERLYDHYIRSAEKIGIRRRSSAERFGKELAKLAPDGWRRKQSRFEETDPITGQVTRGRRWEYGVPPLAECRARFAEIMKAEIAWDDET